MQFERRRKSGEITAKLIWSELGKLKKDCLLEFISGIILNDMPLQKFMKLEGVGVGASDCHDNLTHVFVPVASVETSILCNGDDNDAKVTSR